MVSIFSQPVVTAQTFDLKAFDAAVTLAQSLTQWGFLIIAGSVVIVWVRLTIDQTSVSFDVHIFFFSWPGS